MSEPSETIHPICRPDRLQSDSAATLASVAVVVGRCHRLLYISTVDHPAVVRVIDFEPSAEATILVLELA